MTAQEKFRLVFSVEVESTVHDLTLLRTRIVESLADLLMISERDHPNMTIKTSLIVRREDGSVEVVPPESHFANVQ